MKINIMSRFFACFGDKVDVSVETPAVVDATPVHTSRVKSAIEREKSRLVEKVTDELVDAIAKKMLSTNTTDIEFTHNISEQVHVGYIFENIRSAVEDVCNDHVISLSKSEHENCVSVHIHRYNLQE
jgi:hypothetical protein